MRTIRMTMLLFVEDYSLLKRRQEVCWWLHLQVLYATKLNLRYKHMLMFAGDAHRVVHQQLRPMSATHVTVQHQRWGRTCRLIPKRIGIGAIHLI